MRTQGTSSTRVVADQATDERVNGATGRTGQTGQDVVLGHARLARRDTLARTARADTAKSVRATRQVATMFDERPLEERIEELGANLAAFHAHYAKVVKQAKFDAHWMQQIAAELLPLLEAALWAQYPSARRERPECVRRIRALARSWLGELADGEADEADEADEAR